MSGPASVSLGGAPRRRHRAVRRWAAAALSAALAGCLARWLADAAGMNAETPVRPADLGVLFGLGAGLIHLLLTDAGRITPIDGETRRRILTEAPADGTARLLMSRRGPLGFGVEVEASVDGRVRARLKSPRSTAVELPPGRHEIAAAARDDLSPPLVVVLASGETAAVRIRAGLRGLRLVREQVDDRLRRRLERVAMIEPTEDSAQPRDLIASTR